MKTKKRGKIWSYNPTKYVGTIIEDGTNKRWFFHRGRILSGGTEIIDASVLFVGNDEEQSKPGMLPSAFQIEILDNLSIDVAKTDVKESL
jgi:hypothetical protein